MLINYSFKNFKSYVENTSIDLRASKIKQYEDSCIQKLPKSLTESERMLKSIIMLGANSAGKTNTLKAIQYMRYLVLNSSNASREKENIFDEPETFLFDEILAKKPMEFSVEFTVDDNSNQAMYFQYSFSFADSTIIWEKLYKRDYAETSRLSTKKCLFERDGLNFTKISEQFKKMLDIFEVKNNVLVLSYCTEDLKSDLCVDGKKIVSWFKGINFANTENNSLDIYDDNEEYLDIASKIIKHTNPSLKELRFDKRKLDLGVLDYKNPKAVIKALQKSQPNTGGALRLSEDGLYVFDIFMEYDKKMSDASCDKVSLSIFDNMSNVSSGERKLIMYLAPIIKVLKEGGILLVDEVDTALHYNYSKLILNMFNDTQINKNNAQAIFTTHNVKLMDEMLRVDQIKLVSKNEYGFSSISELKDGEKSARKVHKLSERYLSGVYKAVPSIELQFIKELF